MGFFKSDSEDWPKRYRELEDQYFEINERSADLIYAVSQAEARTKKMADLRTLDGIETAATALALSIDNAYVRSYDSIAQRRLYISEMIKRLLTEQIKGIPEWRDFMDR